MLNYDKLAAMRYDNFIKRGRRNLPFYSFLTYGPQAVPQASERGPTACCPYPRSLEILTTCNVITNSVRQQAFSSVI